MANFTEFKRTYFGETKTFDCDLLLHDRVSGELTISFEPEGATSFVGVEFPLGSVSYGYFWVKRNYNAYHWKGANGNTLLFYFNISKDTQIQKSSVSWVDLIVDIALKPGSPPIILDEEEIPRDISPLDLQIIRNTKREILDTIDKIAEELEIKTARFL